MSDDETEIPEDAIKLLSDGRTWLTERHVGYTIDTLMNMYAALTHWTHHLFEDELVRESIAYAIEDALELIEQGDPCMANETEETLAHRARFLVLVADTVRDVRRIWYENEGALLINEVSAFLEEAADAGPTDPA